MSPLLFLVLAVLTVGAAVTVVAHRNPVHCACALVVTLFLLAVLFVGLEAHLVAALQVIVYAGAVVVLFLFVIMLLNQQAEVRPTSGALAVTLAGAGAAGLAVLLVVSLRHATPPPGAEIGTGYGETRALAERLFTAYLLPFELTSILLLVAIVGAVAIAKRREP